MKAVKKGNLRMILFVIGIVVVMGLTAYPVRETPVSAKYHLDKLVHAGMFLTLAVLGRRAVPLVTSGLVIMTVAVVCELQQRFVPGRHVDALDVLANLVGAGLGLIIFRSVSSQRVVALREGQ